jgi:uncharacterized membrane protein
MIRNPVGIALVLLCIEGVVLFLASNRNTKKYFSFIPSVFWIYCLPMLVSSFGLIDAKSLLYAKAINFLLPLSLFILLVTVDIRAILRLGRKALVMFFAGSMGIGIGTVVVFALFQGIVGQEFWSGFGALAGSWSGGSANMMATKEALGTPDAVFLPMVVVDTIVPYVWMGFLVIVAQHQHRFDQWTRADASMIQDMGKTLAYQAKAYKGMRWDVSVGIICLGLAGAGAAIVIANMLPQIKNVMTTFAWVILIVSTLGVVLSFTKINVIESYGSNKIGYFILYFVLSCIGAKANIAHLGNAAVLIVAGFLIVVIHALILLGVARLLRAPLFLAAVASQANIGGVASAPLIAEMYHKGLASVGLLFAILGNLVGTYFGILVGQLCRYIT